MICKSVQNQILLRPALEADMASHIDSCRDCQDFLTIEKQLTNLPEPTRTCPDSLSFESVLRQSNQTLLFKPLVSIAAAALFLLCIQISVYRPDPVRSDAMLACVLRMEISIEQEIEAIHASLTDLEPFQFEASNQFDLDLESLATDFESLTLEVS